MRLGSILREAWRNVASGTAHAVVLFVVLAVVLGAVVSWESLSTSRLVSDGEQFRAAGSSTLILDVPGAIDGASCDALAAYPDVQGAGSLRARGSVLLDVLPSTPVAVFEATPSLVTAIDLDARPVIAGQTVVSSSVAAALAASPGRTVLVDGVPTPIASTFAYPADGRDPLLDWAMLRIVPDRPGSFDQCWMQAWPPPEDSRGRLLSALEAQGGDGQVEVDVAQLNSRLGTGYDVPEDFASRPWILATAVAGGAAFALGHAIAWRRRLEHGAAMHVGVSRRDLIAIGSVEVLAWSGAAAMCAAVVAVVLTARAEAAVGLLALAPIAMAVPSALAGQAVGILAIRRSSYFRDFKRR